jgi:ribosomal protein S1
MGEDAYLERIKSSRVFISSMRRDITLEQYLEHIKQIRDIMITSEKDSFSQYHEGDIVKCTITSIDGDFIQVNLDDTTFGKVLRSEVRIRNLEVGMELEFYIVEMGNEDQPFKLSWELAQRKKGLHNLINALETGKGLLGKIKSLSVDNTNFMVSMHHNLVFLPLSECTRKMQENPLQYLNKIVTAKVIEIDEPNEKCIVSVSSYNYDKKQKRN